MRDRDYIHLGPVTSIEVNADGKRYTTAEVHGAEGYTADETKAALADNYGIDPDALQITQGQRVSREAGRASVSFSGNWGGSNWEPTGPVPNYGYQPNMN